MLARREGARRPHGRAAEVGRPVRVRQRREGSAVPARAGRAVRGRAGHAGGDRRDGVRGRAAHLSRRAATRSCCSAATKTRPTTPPDVDWDALAQLDGTLVCYAGARLAGAILRRSSTTAPPPTTPAALDLPRHAAGAADGDRHDRRAARARRRGRATADAGILVVGEVAALRDHLRWFDERPLFGRRIVVTRSREQARELVERARESRRAGDRGADVPPRRRRRIPRPSTARRRRSTITTGSSSSRRTRVARFLGGARARAARSARARPRRRSARSGRPRPTGSPRTASSPTSCMPGVPRRERRRRARARRDRSPAQRVLVVRPDHLRDVARGRPRAARRGRDGSRRVPDGGRIRRTRRPPRRLYGMLLDGSIDAVTFTSPTAVRRFADAHRRGAGRRSAQHDGRRGHRPGHGRGRRRARHHADDRRRDLHGGRAGEALVEHFTSSDVRADVGLGAASPRHLNAERACIASIRRPVDRELLQSYPPKYRRQRHVPHRAQARRGLRAPSGSS